MGKISNQTLYPSVIPTDNDYIIGTDSLDSNATKTFFFSDISTYVNTNLPSNVAYTNVANNFSVSQTFRGSVNLEQQHENSFVGSGAGNQGTITGAFNTAFGKLAMASATTANNNTTLGYDALGSALSGNRNIAIGKSAMGNCNNVNNSVAIGWEALLNSTVSPNIAIGSESLKSLVTGGENIAIGKTSMLNSNGASNCISIGSEALFNNTSGSFNIAIGRNALRSIYTGGSRNNIAIGHTAGSGLQAFGVGNGENNIIIGYQAQPSNANASNEITLGNSSISVLRCAVTTITSLSDERDKTDIKPLEYGLDFINSLSAKQFTWNQRDEYITEIDDNGDEVEVLIENANKGKKDFGFIAQEVQPLDNDVLRLVYDENPDKLEISYGKLVPILVKAIQELSAEVKALKS